MTTKKDTWLDTVEVPKRSPRKELITLRLDPDVLDWFRKQGANYGPRINAVLRAYMDAHRQAKK